MDQLCKGVYKYVKAAGAVFLKIEMPADVLCPFDLCPDIDQVRQFLRGVRQPVRVPELRLVFNGRLRIGLLDGLQVAKQPALQLLAYNSHVKWFIRLFRYST